MSAFHKIILKCAILGQLLPLIFCYIDAWQNTFESNDFNMLNERAHGNNYLYNE